MVHKDFWRIKAVAEFALHRFCVLEALGENFQLLHFQGELIVFVLLLRNGLRQIFIRFLQLSQLLQILLILSIRVILLVIFGSVPVFGPLFLDHCDQLIMPFLVFFKLFLGELESLLQMQLFFFPFLLLISGLFFQLLRSLLIHLDNLLQLLIKLLLKLIGFFFAFFFHLLLNLLFIFRVDLRLLLWLLGCIIALVCADFFDKGAILFHNTLHSLRQLLVFSFQKFNFLCQEGAIFFWIDPKLIFLVFPKSLLFLEIKHLFLECFEFFRLLIRSR